MLNEHSALLDEVVASDKANNLMTESQALKQISFPEMDSDGLPSAYISKVLVCLGKWQMKMMDLCSEFEGCKNESMRQFLSDANSIYLSFVVTCNPWMCYIFNHPKANTTLAA